MKFDMSNSKADGAQRGELAEKVVHVGRVAKVVKGGRRFSFSALVVVGDGKGKVGIGLGKAAEVPAAIRKATDQAKKSVQRISLSGTTIPHETTGHFGAGRIVLRPASEGTGVIAGGTVRAVLEVAGIHNILTKSLGSKNPHNVVRATLAGLISLRTPEELSKRRGMVVGNAGVENVG